MGEMRRGYPSSAVPGPADSRQDRAVARAPAQDQELGVPVGVVDIDGWNIVGDLRHLGRPQVGHPLVVLGVVGDVAGDVLLLQATDPMFQARRTGNGPWTGQILVSQVTHEPIVVVDLRGEMRIDRRQRRKIRQAPRLGRVPEEGVREDDHRRPVLDRDAHGFDGDVEAAGGRVRCHDRYRRLAVAAEHGRQEVGRLRFRGHARRWACPHDVDDDHRQLERHRQADGLLLEVQAGAAGSGNAEMTAEGRPQGRPGGGDLVLGLEGSNAEVLVAGQLVKDLRGRRDRIAGVEDGQAARHAGRDEPPGQRRGAARVPIGSGSERGLLDLVGVGEHLGGLPEVVAGLERRDVGFEDRRLALELLLDPPQGHVSWTRVHPRKQAEGEHVLRPLSFLLRDVDALGSPKRDRGHRHLVDLVAGERAVLERIGAVAGLLQVPCA